jgi:hypothetical protein
MSYSTPARRGSTVTGTDAGRSASRARYSDVVLLSEPMTTNRSVRVSSTDTLNRSSGSSNTKTSVEGSWPRRCRQI